MFWREPVQWKTWATVMAVEELNRDGMPIAEMSVKVVVFVEGMRVVLTGLLEGLGIVPEAPG